MADRFCIWIVSPEGLVWSHVFDEVALAMQHAFGELGYDAPIVTDARNIRGTPLVLGANLAPMYGINLPDDAIIYNLEQVHPGSRWFAKDYGYLELLKRHAVWDFSPVNKQALEALGVAPVVLCPVGYAPVLTRKPKAKEDVDVLFIGGGHPRRQKVLDGIKAEGLGLQVVYKQFGAARDNWMARGKIHLNMHKEPAELFEIVRVSYLLANQCFVVSERGRDAALEQPLEGGLVFASYDKLAETCREYLLKPKERKAIAQAGFEKIRALPQRQFLDRALTEHMANRGNAAKKHAPRIFVAIASYRDPEISPTVADLMRRAAQPARVRVGVCVQAAEDEADCLLDAAPYGGQVRVKQLHWKESKGANWARREALKLMDGEDYVLMVDSHMRFEDGWDDALINMLARCPAEKPLISAYVPNYEPPNRRFQHPGEVLRMRVKGMGDEKDAQLVKLSGQLVLTGDAERGGLYPTPFCVANFMFGKASMFEEVPIDPDIYFWGDEIGYAARLWTHGYDIFQPDRVVAYHYWVREEHFHLHRYRDKNTRENVDSAKRVKALMKGKTGEYGLGSQRELKTLWEFAGVDLEKKHFTEFAEQGIWNMAAREKGRSAQTKTALPRIFVQIASYRDPDCQHTVKDLFEKATHPERIFVGICWQFVKGEDDICFTVPYPRPQQVRVHEEDARTGKGVCWARALTQKLWRGEEFTLQIDSHMRFEPGWDELLMETWKECEDERAVLTCYPPGFTPPDVLQKDWIFGMAAKHFDKNDILLMHGVPGFAVPSRLPDAPMCGVFASANMLFGPASIIDDVPYDPHLYFFGEEITLAVRLWTQGYNIFHPNKLVVYHDWERSKRPTHFTDHKNWEEANERSFKRVRHMLGTKPSGDAEITQELERYGLGSVRTLEEYQAYSGVDFSKKTIAQHAAEGKFGRDRLVHISLAGEEVAATQMPRIFVNIASYRDPECQHTVRDLFEKAAHPGRVYVGICWQFDEQEDKHCFEVITRPDQVRIYPVDWREAEGVCWARHKAQQLWEGEEYTLMIDSHMRFVQGWDELCIAELAECDSAKPLLSSSPPSYTPPNHLSERLAPTVRRAKLFQPDGSVRCQGEVLDRAPEKPLRGAFLVANFIFSRSEITREVPYDPYLYFDQEEIMYAARLFTHGWDIFHPTRPFAYHYYNDHKVPGGSVRPLHWRDLHVADEQRIRYLRDRGLRRFNHMTGYNRSMDDDVLIEQGRYGFGGARSLSQYETFSGIDFKRKLTTERALQCQFIDDLRKYRDRPFRIMEAEQEQAKGMKPPPRMGGGQAAAAPRMTPPVQQPVMQPVVQPKLAAAAAAVRLLEVGDILPMFEVPDSENKLHMMEVMAGNQFIMLYLPAAQPEVAANLYIAVRKKMEEANLLSKPVLCLMDEVPDRAQRFRETFKIGERIFVDPNRRISRSLGISRQGEAVKPTGFVLNHNLKITAVLQMPEVESMAAWLVDELALELGRFNKRFPQPRIITNNAPALIVDDVFSPEYCAKLIEAFRNGPTFEGTVGSGEKKAYRENVKRRTDMIVSGELLDEIDDKFSRSYFPEIKKAFGVEIVHREKYKIGLYKAENGGFFMRHRDNFDFPMGYRRIASTIHLNDDYEGGGLVFQEYGPDIYRPAAGSAIAFSGSVVHEALPVTKGERFVLVAFLHGVEDEAYRRHYAMSKGENLNNETFAPKLRQYPELRQGRWFYKEWQEKFVRYDGGAPNNAPAQPAPPTSAANVNVPEPKQPVNLVIKQGVHRPKKIYESSCGIIYDDFLPPDIYDKVHYWAKVADYEFINTKGKVTRAWHVQDGFPLRSCDNQFYYAEPLEEKKGFIYPMHNDVDRFMDAILAIQPEVEHLVGKQGEAWHHFSVTSWLYPIGTSLAMHDDGSGVYTGAYTFFMNPTWRSHWGGLLVLMDEEVNRRVHEHRAGVDQYEFHRQKFLHAGALEDLMLEHGMGKCIFPKGNRIVFIANTAYHMITRVNEAAGDNIRMSFAGFFNRNKYKP